jgi:hypothetical protein
LLSPRHLVAFDRSRTKEQDEEEEEEM